MAELHYNNNMAELQYNAFMLSLFSYNLIYQFNNRSRKNKLI